MAKDVSELVGKKKKVLDRSNMIYAVVDSVNQRNEYVLNPAFTKSILYGKVYFLRGGNNFYDVDLYSKSLGSAEHDTLREALGKSWRYLPAPDQPAASATAMMFAAMGAGASETTEDWKVNNDWPPYAIFYDRGLKMEHCSDPQPVSLSSLRDFGAHRRTWTGSRMLEDASGEAVPGSINLNEKAIHDQTAPGPAATWATMIYEKGLVTEQLIVITCDLRDIEPTEYDPDDQRTWPTLDKWAYLMKTGLFGYEGQFTAPGTLLYPVVLPSFYEYHDTYHEANSPFTKKELLEKQPAGKSFFAEVSTYYNERMRDKTYENFLSNQYYDKSPTGLPSIYGLLHLILQDIDLQKLYQQLLTGTHSKAILENPLEALIISPYRYGQASGNGKVNTDFQLVPKEVIEGITKINSKNKDVQGAFEKYFKEWTRVHAGSAAYSSMPGASTAHNPRPLLEQYFRNIAFSPYVTKIFDVVEKYKKYFPMYTKIEFTAELNTEIGDLIKKTMMTRYLTTKIAEASGYQWGPGMDKKQFESAWVPGAWKKTSYIDIYEEKVYEDLNSDSYLSQTELLQAPKRVKANFKWSPEGPKGPGEKKILNLPVTLLGFINDATHFVYSPNDLEPLETMPLLINNIMMGVRNEDVQDFIAFIDNGKTETIDLSDHNPIFRKIFGNILLQKVVETYEKHKRTYKDLIEGVPAYTEDLFYKIEKYEKIASADDVGTQAAEVTDPFEGYRLVQNIIIPNTSDLDIVKYIDTQVKYSHEYPVNGAAYRYRIYAERVVFGSKYRYFWVNENGTKQYPLSHYLPGTLQDANDTVNAPQNTFAGGLWQGVGVDEYDMANGNGGKYKATVKVKLEPHIVMLEDLMFSTPKITIIDRPPPSPDINIVPYRGVNNKIKMMFNGTIDRYRAFPISITSVDGPKFSKIKKSQLTPDGKVEFGADDIANIFEIFRTKTRPTSYTDFKFYKTVVGKAFEEKILPNTKYYYTFRSVDSHKNISNPTAVYEVELIDIHGAVKPLIRTISLDAIETEGPTKECKRFLLIRPTPQQIYEPMKGGQIDTMFTDEETTWQEYIDPRGKKKFKIRLTSKSSGKKIDINLQFKRTGISTITEDIAAATTGGFSWITGLVD